MWRIDRVLKSSSNYETGLCSRLSDAPGNFAATRETHFYKRYLGDRSDREFEYFQRQACIAATIQHPKLCGLEFHCLDAGPPLLVFARIPGRTLDRWLVDQPQIPTQRECLRLSREMLEALEALHQHGYVHANLRSEHLLLDANDRLTLIGCGGCEEVGARTCQQRTATKYDAPEVIACEYEASSAQDVFAAGVVTLEILGPHLQFSPIIQAMLAPNPEARPTSGELVRLFQEMETNLQGNYLRKTAKHPIPASRADAA